MDLDAVQLKILGCVLVLWTSCCMNLYCLESIVKTFPGAGNLVNLCQFVFITITGFTFTMQCGKKTNMIPISRYVLLVAMFFITNAINNSVFQFNIQMPLVIVFRSSQLVGTLLMSILCLRKRYISRQYIAVFMVTFGVILTTLASYGSKAPDSKISVGKDNASPPNEPINAFGLIISPNMSWFIGVVLLATAIIIGGYMSVYQENMFAQCGKYPAEAQFFQHALALPLFIPMYSDIYKHVLLFSATDEIWITWPLVVTKPWVLVLFNAAFAFVCTYSVNQLFALGCTGLTVSLVTTLRKVVSLILSVIYFSHPFTLFHVLGSAAVFFGSFLYTLKPADMPAKQITGLLPNTDAAKQRLLDPETKIKPSW